MATEMPHHSWDDYGLRRPKKIWNKYPWEEWLNGHMWLLIQGEDYDTDTETFQNYVYQYASRHNIIVKTQQNEERTGLYIKAVKNNTRTGLRRSRHFRNLKRNRRYTEERNARDNDGDRSSDTADDDHPVSGGGGHQEDSGTSGTWDDDRAGEPEDFGGTEPDSTD